MSKYPISSYNKHICLKANEFMLITFLFLMKPYLVTLFSIVNRKDRSAIIDMFYPDRLFLSLEALSAVPIVFLVIAWIKRTPDASEKIKLIWKNGKKIIMVTAILQLLVTSSPLWMHAHLSMTNIAWVSSAIYVFIIVVTPFSGYMTDCFADFPVHHEDSKESDGKV